LSAHEVDAALVRTVKAHTDALEASLVQPINVVKAWSQIRARMDETSNAGLSVVRGGASKRPNVRALPSRSWKFPAFAAAAAVLAFVGYRAWPSAFDSVREARVVATGVGERDSVRLSDGSRIVLAPGSRVTVSADFDRGDRSVVLEGVAFFDVKHDEAHPFTVRAAGAEVRDIGTSFTVKTSASGRVSVAVTHGTVALRQVDAASLSAVELHAGDRGVMAAGTVAVSRGTVTEADMSWTRGQLSYRDTPLAEVQSDLKRWYGINLVVTDSALARLTVTMTVQQDSANVMGTMALALGAETQQRGDTIFLHSAGRGTKP
jgi:transmembrane sensor